MARQNLHAALAQGLGHALAGVLILIGQDAGAGHGVDHLAAKDAQQRGHFNADIGGIGDKNRSRGFLHVQQGVRGEGRAGKTGHIGRVEHAARGHDDVFGLKFFAVHFHAVGAGYFRHARDDFRAVVGQQCFHTHADVVGHALFAGQHRVEVQLAHSQFKAEFSGIARLFKQGGGAQPYLAGNAAAHDAGAAHIAAFDQSHLTLEL